MRGRRRAGRGPKAIVAAPNGGAVYVADSGSDTVTPINTATGKPGTPVRVGLAPWALAVTPDGKTLYVADSGSGTVTPVAAGTAAGQAGTAGTPIPVGRDPRAIALTPDGSTAYVLNWLSGTVTPIATATNRPGRAQPAGYAPDALAATTSGVYAVDGNSDEVTRLGSRTATRVGYSPAAIAVSGGTAYVVNTVDSTVTPLNTRTGKAAKPLSVGAYTYPTAIALAGTTAIVVEPYGYSVDLMTRARTMSIRRFRWALSRTRSRLPADREQLVTVCGRATSYSHRYDGVYAGNRVVGGADD